MFSSMISYCAPQKLEKGKKKSHHVDELGDVRLDKQKKWLQSRAGLPLPTSSPTTNWGIITHGCLRRVCTPIFNVLVIIGQSIKSNWSGRIESNTSVRFKNSWELESLEPAVPFPLTRLKRVKRENEICRQRGGVLVVLLGSFGYVIFLFFLQHKVIRLNTVKIFVK